MEIGRLDFYATERDKDGGYFGKIYPYSSAMRNNHGDSLVSFHESSIPSTSALRTDASFRDYRFKKESRGIPVFDRIVYVAFEVSRNNDMESGPVASIVMLLGEADPDELPPLGSVVLAGVGEVLIGTFPSYYTLSRIGTGLLQDSDNDRRLFLFRACWDRSNDDERLSFMESLDSDALAQAIDLLFEIDKLDQRKPAGVQRARRALALRPDLVLRDNVAMALTPDLWVDEFLDFMRSPEGRNALLEHVRPEFRAYALAKYVESDGPLDREVTNEFVASILEVRDGAIRSECLRTLLAKSPIAALRGDVIGMLTPNLWVDGFQDIMDSPEGRRAITERAQPEFRAYALAKFVESGGVLDKDGTEDFVVATSKIRNANLRTECLRALLEKRPDLALRDDIIGMLTPSLWVDGFQDIMGSAEGRRSLLEHASPTFIIFTLNKLVAAGGRLGEDAAEDLVAAALETKDDIFRSEILGIIIAKEPKRALGNDVIGMLTPDLWSDGLLGPMGSPEGRRSLLTHAQSAFREFALARFVEAGGPLDEDAVEDLVMAALETKNDGLRTAILKAVISKDPKRALRDDIIGMLTPRLWVDGLLGPMGSPESQGVILASLNPDFRAFAINKLIDSDAPLCREVFSLCTFRSCPALIDRVRWSDDDVSYAEMIGRWLDEASLGDAGGRKRIVLVAERMHASGELLSPTMWANLPVVMRVRLCLYWSNHYAGLNDYVVRGGITRLCVDAYRSSWKGYDQALKAALLLLALPLSKNPQKAFLDANDALIGEIVRQFNECGPDELQSFALGDGLQALLQRCTSFPYASEKAVRGFCDGRAWDKDDGTKGVWCHFGMDRPEGGRRECKSQPLPIIVSGGWRGLLSIPEDQFMADLLVNVNEAMGGVDVGPWIMPGKKNFNMGLVEYAYRVSGYVNKLASTLPHMVCRGCGARLRLNYKYPREGLYGRSLDLPTLSGPAISGTVCSCPNAGDGGAHDEDIYIHYCRNCHRVIDSRECRMRDVKADGSPGLYLCMYCGASADFDPATACPSCRNTDLNRLRYYRGSMKKEMQCVPGSPPSGEILIACRRCGYDAREFNSEFE